MRRCHRTSNLNSAFGEKSFLRSGIQRKAAKVTEVTKGAEGWLKIKDKEWMWRRTNCKAPPFD